MASNGLDFTQAAFIESLAAFEYASRMQDADHCWQSLFSTLVEADSRCTLKFKAMTYNIGIT